MDGPRGGGLLVVGIDDPEGDRRQSPTREVAGINWARSRIALLGLFEGPDLLPLEVTGEAASVCVKREALTLDPQLSTRPPWCASNRGNFRLTPNPLLSTSTSG